jgi:hypothetical protein
MHPALQKGSLPGLTRGVEYPIELVPDIPVELGAYQTFFRREAYSVLPGYKVRLC